MKGSLQGRIGIQYDGRDIQWKKTLGNQRRTQEMQGTWQKDSKKSTEKSQDKQEKKIIESFIEKNYQRGIQQRHYMDGMIRGLIRNIGDDQKEIGDIEKEHKRKRHWKQSRNKKRNKKQRDQEQKSGTKKTKWATYKTHTMNCKVLRTRTPKKGILL